MAKRASIKGRGADILFGGKAPPKKRVRELAPGVNVDKLLGGEADLMKPELGADLEKAFGVEAMAMEPVPPTTPATPAGGPAPPRAKEFVSPPMEVPPSSEPTKVFVTLKVEEPTPSLASHAPGVGGIPTPTYTPPSPAPKVETPPPSAMPPREWEKPVYEPSPRMPEPAPVVPAPTVPSERPLVSPYAQPSPRKPEPATAVPTVSLTRPLVSPYDQPPPEIKPGGYLLEHPVALGEGAGLPTGVVPREARVEAVSAEKMPPQVSPQISERTVLGRLGEERQQTLFKEMDALIVEAAQVLSVDKGLEQALTLLREARDITIERPRQFDEAEYRVAKVRAMLERRKISGRWSVIYGYPVLIYEVVCFLLLLGSLVSDHSLAVFIANATGMIFSSAEMAVLSMENIFPYWNTMAWGGIGGVVGSLYSLYWHASQEQDFDRQYLMWYVVQPIMGLILGGIVYLLFASGFVSIQVLAGQAPTIEAATKAMSNFAIKAFHSVVACIAGFRQRFVFEMLDKIVQILTPRPKTKAEREAEEKEKEKEKGKETEKSS